MIIFDEAHQLPDIATTIFWRILTARQLFELSTDINGVYRTELKIPEAIRGCC